MYCALVLGLPTVLLSILTFRTSALPPWTETEQHRSARDSTPQEVRGIRLVGGPSYNEGRVEILVGGQWGTVCDDSWDINDATVACRQLGYPSAISAHGTAQFGEGSGPIVLDDLSCLGQETSLLQCSHVGIGRHNCLHTEDAGVKCQSGIRLVGSSIPFEGRVEVFVNNVWGTVCDDSWDINDADVVCKQAGYEGATEAFTNAQFGQGIGRIQLDEVGCIGSEASLLECTNSGLGNHNCGHSEDAGVRCLPNIRLAGGVVPTEGRVELSYNGQWGTVCDDFWDNSDAQVVCREMGLGTTGATAVSTTQFGPGSGPILMDDVGCTGSEWSLLECSHSGLRNHNCGHNEDAGVICNAATVDEVRGIRLVGGPSYNEGRVEILVGGQWGTICDDSWDINDATVACRQLGYPSAISAHGTAQFGEGSGPIVLDDLSCLGQETSLLQCSHVGIGRHNCLHTEDAGVKCQSGIRLVGSSIPFEGRVEVLVNNVWGTVCDDSWDINDADVVCKQAGYEGATEAFTNAQFGQGIGRIQLDEVGCIGSETSLLECTNSGLGNHNCGHSEDAGVRCLPNIRLAGGVVPTEGRVELSYNGQWGTVCDDFWDNSDAQVVCREMGLGTTGATAVSTTQFGPGSGPILMDDVGCTGSEWSLLQCSHSGLRNHNCGHNEDAGVICNAATVDGTRNIRLADGFSSNEGRVEIKINSQWGTICDDSWDINDAQITCRELDFPGATLATSSARFGQGTGTIFLDNVSCAGHETRLMDCSHNGPGVHDCDHSEDAGVICQANVRLVGGSLPSEGRVEVFHSNQWGTICDDTWDIADATVVCKQIGFPSAIAYVRYAGFGEGSGPIYLDNLKCEGSENSLFECQHHGVGIHDCGHAEDAGVVCSHAVRLVNGLTGNEGRVEVYLNNQWGTVCDDEWDITDASIVCNEIGFPNAVEAAPSGHFGEGSGPILMNGLRCQGSETSLWQCPQNGERNCQHLEDAGVVCGVNVRLSGSSQDNEGRVEVYYNGQWGTVCDDGWDITDANVVCHQLGFTKGALEATTESRFGLGVGPIIMDDVDCGGIETDLLQCSSPGLGVHNCGHYEDAGVICQNSGGIRLVDGSSSNEGRVEIFHNNIWGTVCDDAWDLQDAQVVCRQLGFLSAVEATHQARFGAGEGPILFDDVVCVGSESNLTECLHSGFGQHNCGHHEDAGVICREGTKVNLVGGHTRNEGRVEIFANNQWGTVCDDSWDINDAHVVCRQLGFSEAIAAVSSALFGLGDGPIMFDDLHCSGNEASLIDCSHSGVGVHNCDHLEDAGVICRPMVRLVGGFSPNEGRVEIFMDSSWGTVCNINWDLDDSAVVCRELGFRGALGISITGHFDQGTGPIHMSDVGCSGTEELLSDCIHNGYGEHSCGHHQDAGVVCSVPIRLIGGSSYNEGRIEIFFDGMWGSICDTMWDIDDANVACRELGFTQAVEATTHARFGQGAGMIFLEEVQCVGTEEKMIECTIGTVLGMTSCTHVNDAGVICQAPETVRLVGGSSSSQGRVEIFHEGVWGSICDDSWDINDGHVVCRQLGYIEAQDIANESEYGGGSGPIHMDDVRCTGHERSIFECTHGGLGVHNCNHQKDAGVVCIVPDTVRLSGGDMSYLGRVEILLNQQWGTVCDNLWDIDDAQVVCRELGFPGAVGAPVGAMFGEGTGPIHLEQLQCGGNEQSLLKCSHGSLGDDCGHSQDASVICQPLVRLVGGNTNLEGRVEIFYNGAWGTVCDDMWELPDAEVACHQLGFNSARQATTQARFGSGAGPIHLDDVTCSGSETTLLECSHSGLGSHNCDHQEDAGVICSFAANVRLVGGTLRREGQVEVNVHADQWGTVCVAGWDIADAHVLCRQLGYPMAMTAYINGQFGHSTTVAVISNLQCSGSEEALTDCPHKGQDEIDYCEYRAGVQCAPRSRLVGGYGLNQGRVEIYMNDAWGTVCDDLWDSTDATVVCREMGFTVGSPMRIFQHLFLPGTGAILMDDVQCRGSEESLLECPHSNAHNCQHYEDAGAQCT